jgi:hypothetical protein
MDFEKYTNQSGFGMDSNGMVTGSPESLTTYYANHPKARQFAISRTAGGAFWK